MLLFKKAEKLVTIMMLKFNNDIVVFVQAGSCLVLMLGIAIKLILFR